MTQAERDPKPRYRILHVLNELDENGNGIVNMVVDLSTAQAKLGHEVAIASSGGAFVSLVRRSGVRHFHVAHSRSRRRALTDLLPLARVIHAFRPTVVHAHMLTGTVISRALRPFFGYRLITTMHNEYQPGSGVMAFSDQLVAVSSAVAASLRKRWYVRSARVSVVHNGTFGSLRFEKEARFAPVLLQPAVVAVGAVSHRKGTDVLVAAWDTVEELLPGAHLYILGNTDWAELVSEAQLRHPGTIHFQGFDPNPSAYIEKASVFVLASRRDPFPLVLLEARRCGVPIVASAVDGVPEALDHGLAGILVPPGDALALASAIANVLRDDALAAQLREATQRDTERFAASTMAVAYDAVYARCSARSTGNNG